MNKLKLSILGFVGVISLGALSNDAQASHRGSHYRSRTVQHHSYHRPVVYRRVTHHVYPRPVYVHRPVVQRVIYQPAYTPIYQPCPTTVQVIEQPVYVEPVQPGWGMYMNSNGQVGVQINSQW